MVSMLSMDTKCLPDKIIVVKYRWDLEVAFISIDDRGVQ